MKKIIIVVVNGFPRAGKDTFVSYCRNVLINKHYRTANISSVDNVKKAATLLGWDGAKDAKGRKFLSELKDYSTEMYDGPMQYMRKCIAEIRPSVYPYAFFFHIREPKEIARFVEEFPETVTMIVHRPDAEMHDNTGDAHVPDYNYNVHVHNDGTLEELYIKAKNHMEEICK